MEIERKFLPTESPALHYPRIGPTYRIEQGYLSTKPEVRIHRKFPGNSTIACEHKMTIKSDGTLAREEITIELNLEQYLAVRAMIPCKMITKEYSKYLMDGGYTVEYSIVDSGLPSSFDYLEVEFESEEDAKDFVPPAFFGYEVTNALEYKMKHYWQHGRTK